MRSFLKTALVAATAFGALAVGTTSQAAVTTYNSLSAWEAAAGTFAETTSLGASDSATINSFTTTDGIVVTSHGTVLAIGDGWGTWSGGYTGQVLWANATLVNFGLGSAVTGFGMFVEPDEHDVFDITLTTSGGGTITESVNGDGGAAFFGWTGAGVTSFTLSSADDFAAGDFFSASGSTGGVPEASTWALMLLGFGGVGATLRASRRRQATATA
jgi:PEP-CTERM motif-containing protein